MLEQYIEEALGEWIELSNVLKNGPFSIGFVWSNSWVIGA